MKNVPYKAPNFNLPDDTGTMHSLADYSGKWVVLYFYPKDETAGCTVEACSMRDARDDLAALGAEIVGVSKDDASSHEKFKAHHSLNFTLLMTMLSWIVTVLGARNNLAWRVRCVKRLLLTLMAR